MLKQVPLDILNSMSTNNMVSHLGIEITEVGEDFIKATMPVDQRTTQPFGLLHGGANVTLAETLGSLGSTLTIDQDNFLAVGQEINANHLKSVTSGSVTGIASPIHMGKKSQVWEIKIHDDQDRLVCISRMTIVIIPRKK